MAIRDDLIFTCPMQERTSPAYVCELDGTDGCVQIDAAKGLFSVANDFTMSLRFKADVTSGSTTYLLGAAASANDRFAIAIASDLLKVGAQSAAGEVRKSVAFTDTASWHLLEVAYDTSSHAITASLDGVAMTSTDAAYPSSLVGATIGAKSDGSGNYYNGKIAEVTSYNSAGYLNARWQLNDGSGTVAVEDWGNRYPGTLSGGAAYVVDSTGPEVQKESLFDRSGNNFHLTPQQYSIPSVDIGGGEYWREFTTNRHCRIWELFNEACGKLVPTRPSGLRTPGPFTIAFSYIRDDGTADDAFFGVWKTDTDDRSLMIRAIGGAFRVYWCNDGTAGESETFASTVDVEDENEHNVVIKYDGTSLFINVDGTKDEFAPAAAYHAWPSNYYFGVGAIPSASLYYEGKMRDATLWLRAVTNAEENAWIADQSIARADMVDVDVYVLAGQSNATQKGTDSEITTSDYVSPGAMWFMADPGGGTYEPPAWGPGISRSGTKYLLGKFGPELSFMKVGDGLINKTVAVLGVGVGSTRLNPVSDEWAPGDTTFNNGLLGITNGMNELKAAGLNATVRGVLWVHGESDATDDNAASYAAWFASFASALRTWLYETKGYSEVAQLPFVVSKLNLAQADAGSIDMARVLAMQAAQEDLAASDAMVTAISTETVAVESGDEIHFSSAGMLTLGALLAGAIEELGTVVDLDEPTSPNSGLPAEHAYEVTPSDTALQPVTRYIYVGGTGDIKIETQNEDTVTIKSIPVGSLLEVRAKKIYLTGTTATEIVGLY